MEGSGQIFEGNYEWNEGKMKTLKMSLVWQMEVFIAESLTEVRIM